MVVSESSKPPFFLSVLGLILFFVVITPAVARCAYDGDLDNESTGGTSVSLSISNLVRITNISDFDFGSYSGQGNLSMADDVCVWTNQSSGNYKVTMQGSGAAHAFTVTSGPGQFLNYAVRWNNATGTSGNVALNPDEISSTFSGASTSSSTCSGGVNSNIQIVFTENDLLAARPGVYSGVLTIIISP